MTLSARLFPGLLGLGAVLIMAGCGHDHGEKDGHKHHSHPSKGPNGGLLVEWGNEEYHPELLRDPKKQQVTVHLWDKEVKKRVPIKAESIVLFLRGDQKEIKLKAMPMPEEKDGASSRFVSDPDERLKTTEKIKGNLRGAIDGRNYDGDFDESKKGHTH